MSDCQEETFDAEEVNFLVAWAKNGGGSGSLLPHMPTPLPEYALTDETYRLTKPAGHWFPIWADDGKLYFFRDQPIPPNWREKLSGNRDARVFIEDSSLAVFVPPEVH